MRYKRQTNMIRMAGASDRGQVRERNEDCWFASSEHNLLMVADGMGRQNAGNVASKVVIQALASRLANSFTEISDLTAPSAAAAMTEAITWVCRSIYEESQGVAGMHGMGSTVVAGVIRGRHLLVGHLGDSRGYLFRSGRIEQLTRDHTLAQLLFESNEITASDLRNHPGRSKLTRYVGMEDTPLPEVRVVELRACDRLLFCTDGLFGSIAERQIVSVLQEQASPEEAAQKLVACANQAGGMDNITAVVLDVCEVDATKATPT